MTQFQINITIGLIIGSVLFGSLASGDEAKQLAEIQSLVTALRENIMTDRGPGDTSRSPLLRSTPDLVKALSACGEPAIPIIVSALKQEKYPDIAFYLAFALSCIPGEQTGKTLVSLFHSEPTIHDAVLEALVNRAKIMVRAGSTLPTDEILILEEILKEDNGSTVKTTAEILSTYKGYTVTTAIKALVNNLIHRVENPIPTQGHTMSYLPNQIVKLNQLCYAIGFWGERAFPVLREEKKANNNPDVQKWLNIALGGCGDREVGDILAEIVKDKTDPYVCFCAIWAYGRSMKKEAIPLLQTLKDDTTVTEYGGAPLQILKSESRVVIAAIESGETKRIGRPGIYEK